LSSDVLTDKIRNSVINAFDRIHQLGIAHHDIRPENVLIETPQDTVWIIDFELAGAATRHVCQHELQSVKSILSEMILKGKKEDNTC
jgi:serine/threonine protein kinase